MTAETDLLPLPERWTAYSCMSQSEMMDLLHDHARACVSSATEALRAKAAEHRDGRLAALERAERLAEALRDAADDLDRGVSRGDVAAHMRARAALEQETTNE